MAGLRKDVELIFRGTDQASPSIKAVRKSVADLTSAVDAQIQAAARGEGIRGAWRPVAAMLLAGVLAFWWTQFQGAPAVAASHATQGIAHDQKDD